jgi:nucleoside-diphosphate-sugar epimerase
VTALARSLEKAEWLRQQGTSPIVVSIYDRVALAEALSGHDAVVNLASAIPLGARFIYTNAWAENDRVRKEGSATIVDAALDAGVNRFIQESVSMIYPDRGDEWIDEQCPNDNFPMADGNLATEASSRRFANSGGTAVVLRFGWFYGPGAKHSEEFFSMARCHIAVMMGSPGGYVSSIHVTDAGEAVAAALTVPPGTYNIVDDEPLTKAAYADAISAAAGTTQWIRLPGRAALLLGNRLTSLTRSLRVRNAHFQEASGWKPRYPSAVEGWRATAEVLLGRQ